MHGFPLAWLHLHPHFSLGDMYEVGAESGRYYCLNVPLRDGIDDQSKCSSLPSCSRGLFPLSISSSAWYYLLLDQVNGLKDCEFSLCIHIFMGK